jgi:hypothetical protein
MATSQDWFRHWIVELRLQIRIRAYHDAAPKTSELVTNLARTGGSNSLNFYRHEHDAEVHVQNVFDLLPHSIIWALHLRT